MTTEQLREKVHVGIDQHCAPLTSDPYLMQRVLSSEVRQRSVIMVKKRTVAFIVAVALILLSVTAFATIGYRLIYEYVIKQEGENGRIEDWSTSNKVALIELMVEAGVSVDQATLDVLRDEKTAEQDRNELAWSVITEYYPSRDGVLTAVDVMAKELGPIEKWSLEDRAWLSQMFAQHQPTEVEYGMNLLPDQQAITQEAALEAFYEHYKNEYGIDETMFIPESATFFFGESTFDDGSGPQVLRRWVINMKLTTGEEMGAYIRADGQIISATAPNNMEKAWRTELNDDMRNDSFLTVDGMYEFSMKWRSRLNELRAVGEDVDVTALPYFLDGKEYGLPSAGEISRDEAYQYAVKALTKQENWTPDSLKYYDATTEAYRTEDPDGAVYWISFMRVWSDFDLATEAIELGYPVIVTVKVDPTNGEIREIVHGDMYFKNPTDRYGM